MKNVSLFEKIVQIDSYINSIYAKQQLNIGLVLMNVDATLTRNVKSMQTAARLACRVPTIRFTF